jgi:hypothetical protein
VKTEGGKLVKNSRPNAPYLVKINSSSPGRASGCAGFALAFPTSSCAQ